MCWDLIFPIIFSVCFLCNTFNVWNRPYHTYVQILTNSDPRWPHLTEGNMKLCSMPWNIDAFHCLSIRSTLFKNTISESYIMNQTTEDCLNNLGTPHSKGISIFLCKNCTVFFLADINHFNFYYLGICKTYIEKFYVWMIAYLKILNHYRSNNGKSKSFLK